MDEIMEHAGMLRLLCIGLLKNPGGFKLPRVGFVLVIDRFIQRQGVENRRLDVL